MPKDRVLEWLLEEEQPSVRYLALTQLLDRRPDDPEVRHARSSIPLRGWGVDLLRDLTSGAGGGGTASLYLPKYHARLWPLLVLADLGMTREDARIRSLCEFALQRLQRENGGIGIGDGGSAHLCTTANLTRALIQVGYLDDPRVARALDWLVQSADRKGGWSCYGSGRLLDSWEPLSTFAAYPRDRWTDGIAEAAALGAEYFLGRELHQQGERYAPWYRTHYPVHYYYDLLQGLDALTALGYGRDPRLGFALGWLRDRRLPTGRWNLDAVHPDVDGSIAAWFEKHPKRRPTPLVLEAPARPSKIVTLTARRVLARVEAAGPPPTPPAVPPRETPPAASRGS
ncbi:MAG: hypothetical protein L3J77_04880, partial [Thermoplasmata archaeon]|nr:hypothetical protein [Thermoplasmata archaeon]